MRERDRLANVVRSCTDARDLLRGREIYNEIKKSPHSGNTFLANLLVLMYGRCSRPFEAFKLFQSTTQRNSFSWNIMLQVFSDNRDIRCATATFHRMPHHDTVVWNALLAANAQKGYLEKAERVFQALLEKVETSLSNIHTAFQNDNEAVCTRSLADELVNVNERAWNTMIAAYAQYGQFSRAKTLFDEMPRGRGLITWNIILFGFAREGHLEDARATFHKMPVLSPVTWTSLLSGLAANGHLDEAKHEFDSMPERNAVTWAALFQALVDAAGHLGPAKLFFERMPQRPSVTWNALFHALVRDGHLAAATEAFAAMPERDVIAKTLMISAYSEAGMVQQARLVFDSIQRDEHDMLSQTEMIKCYVQHGVVEEARKLMDAMPVLDAVIQTLMIAAYAQRGDLHESRRLFEAMESRDILTWNIMVTGYARYEKLAESTDLFQRMPATDLIAWNAMIAVHAQGGHIEQARWIFDTMPARDTISWNAMLTGYSTDRKMATEFFQIMSQEGWEVDEVSVTIVLASRSHLGMLEASRSFFLSMLSDFGVAATREQYRCMVDALARSGRLGDAQELVESMPFLPEAVSWKTVLSGCKLHCETELAAQAAERASELQPGNSAPYMMMAGIFSSSRNHWRN